MSYNIEIVVGGKFFGEKLTLPPHYFAQNVSFIIYHKSPHTGSYYFTYI